MKTVGFQSAFLCSLLLTGLIYGCRENQTTESNAQWPEFAPGQIAVKTDSTITLDYFESFIDSLHLSILSRNHDNYYFWIEVNADSVTAAIVELSKIYSLFTSVTESSYPFSDSVSTMRYIFAVYKSGQEASDTSEGIAVLEQHGMVLKRIIIQPRESEIFALLAVPIGEELKWVGELKKFPFIEFAEPNYIMHVD